MSGAAVVHSECLAYLATLATNSIDSVVTDPPYELNFMGRDWDRSGIANQVELWRAVYRVLKPGAHLVAFGGTRTAHRMVCAIEDAGFEIRDSLHWLYGSGFPKNKNVSKALDKAAGAERAVVGQRDTYVGTTELTNFTTKQRMVDITAPATDLAAQWDGWGTALKPAHEPIVLARKPIAKTVAATIAAYGTGGINVEACRVSTNEDLNGGTYSGGSCVPVFEGRRKRLQPDQYQQPAGRWPPNVLLTHAPGCVPVGMRRVAGNLRVHSAAQTGAIFGSVGETTVGPRGYGDPDGTETVAAYDCAPGCPVAALDEQSGVSKSIYKGPSSRDRAGFMHSNGKGANGTSTAPDNYGDTGGASRFYPILNYDPVYDAPFLYCAKASRKERNAGNHHPTVKPVTLCRWLVRLVTPVGGTVLDPFAGSGSVGVACVLEGRNYMGCDQEAEYVEIANRRIVATQPALLGV